MSNEEIDAGVDPMSPDDRQTSLEIVKAQCNGLVLVSEEGEPLYRWRKTIFFIICWSWFALGIPNAGFNSAIDKIETDLNMGSTTSGLIVGLPGIIASVTGMILLYFGEKVSMKLVISLSIISGGCHWILISLCTEPWHMFLILPLRAFSYLFLITAPVLLDHMAPNAKRGFRVQFMFAMGAFGLAAGYTLGAKMVGHWQLFQAVSGIILILTGGLNYFLMRQAGIQLALHDGYQDPFFAVVKLLCKKRGYIITVLMVSGVWSPVAGWSVYFVKWVNDRYYDSADEDTPATILGGTIILASLYSVFGGWSVDKFVTKKKKKYGVRDSRLRLNSTLKFLMAFYIPAVIIAPFVFIQDNVTLYWILLEIFFFFIAFNPFTQGHLWAGRHEEKDLPGLTVLALVYLVNQATDGCMILLVGYLLDHTSQKTAFEIPTIWTCVMFISAALLYVKRQKSLGYPLLSVQKKAACLDDDDF